MFPYDVNTLKKKEGSTGYPDVALRLIYYRHLAPVSSSYVMRIFSGWDGDSDLPRILSMSTSLSFSTMEPFDGSAFSYARSIRLTFSSQAPWLLVLPSQDPTLMAWSSTLPKCYRPSVARILDESDSFARLYSQRCDTVHVWRMRCCDVSLACKPRWIIVPTAITKPSTSIYSNTDCYAPKKPIVLPVHVNAPAALYERLPDANKCSDRNSLFSSGASIRLNKGDVMFSTEPRQPERPLIAAPGFDLADVFWQLSASSSILREHHFVLRAGSDDVIPKSFALAFRPVPTHGSTLVLLLVLPWLCDATKYGFSGGEIRRTKTTRRDVSTWSTELVRPRTPVLLDGSHPGGKERMHVAGCSALSPDRLLTKTT
ncbi:uncharacterized protein BT62DRAFT_1005325 [Guyanagaster necrorhizus]|uniref:Uncharacterized protein n=1 Tax=Guyanagaster necrorhizus TaxID=856835 RepID=A0A9P8AT00_9AGAR|nr:uncharacterized protein BT62DRAFT_1005325 [Guyanagaster necrorhizus MCA 3950]KAG7446928.1 hypothetical protein BT62DRAFT_1005325 [Guyanagaster necrorhizus MCA 3950]